MNPVIKEVIEYLKSWDVTPTKENIKEVLTEWINNLYSHIGVEAHKNELALGIKDETGLSWEEQDNIMLSQIEDYKNALDELENGGQTNE